MKKRRYAILIGMFIIFLIPLVLAEEIELNYPDSVIVGEEFNVVVKLIDFNEDVYDIKFEIKEGSSNIAERYDDGWRSTYYYANDFIDISKKDEETIKLKIVNDYEGLKDFKVKLKDSSNKVFTFESYVLNIGVDTSNNSSEEDNPSEGNNSTPTGGGSNSEDIYYQFNWDDEDIINGEEFRIEVDVFNLEDEFYDARLWIEFEDNDTIISEMYDDKGNEWKSGNYYTNELFDGPGDESESIKIRIKEIYRDYYGDAKIFFRLRDEEEIDGNIEILEKKVEEENAEVVENKVTGKVTSDSSKELIEEYLERDAEKGTIRLGQKSEDLKAENTIYESKTSTIKKVSIYAFIIFIIALVVLVVWRRL